MAEGLTGAGTMWEQAAAADEAQVRDNDYLWEILFVTGHQRDVRPVTFGGRAGVNPGDLWAYLLNKQQDADALADSPPRATPPADRCVFCRHQFGSKYEDALFGKIEIRRNSRNRNYCNQCDYFIRVCPGQTTLTLPVMVVDVKHSSEIRRQVADLRQYARLLQRFQHRVVGEVQRTYGFVINTIGDAVLAVWPSGFTPPALRKSMGWDDRHPGKIAAICAIDTATALVKLAPKEFDGRSLPFRGAIDTTEMCLFAVAGDESDVGATESFADSEAAAYSTGLGATEAPLGPTAVDITGEAVEVASDLASHGEADAGRMYVSRRTDVEAGSEAAPDEYRSIGGSAVTTRVI